MNPLRVDGVKSLGPDKTPRDSVDRAAGKLSSCSLLVPRLFAPRAGEVAIWAGPLRMVSEHRCHCFGVYTAFAQSLGPTAPCGTGPKHAGVVYRDQGKVRPHSLAAAFSPSGPAFESLMSEGPAAGTLEQSGAQHKGSENQAGAACIFSVLQMEIPEP